MCLLVLKVDQKQVSDKTQMETFGPIQYEIHFRKTWSQKLDE